MKNKTLVIAIMVGTIATGGCASYKRNDKLVDDVKAGNYAVVRETLAAQRSRDANDRNFILDRMKQVIISLADGAPQSSEGTVDYLYDYLRMQGLNQDKTVSAFLTTEMNARIWKGEPFEQAMAYSYIATFDGMNGDWGNVRASAENSLFLLRDFSEVLHKAAEAEAASKDPNESEAVRQRRLLIQEAAKKDEGRGADDSDDLGIEYATTDSDFELGYALKAIACRQLGLTDELNETLAKLVRVAPHLNNFAHQIRSAQYNTVLVVDYGTGPLKYGAGMDNVIAMFRSTMTDPALDDLIVRVGNTSSNAPIATNLDRLAQDLKWNNLEDMRKAKSYIGTGMVVVGAGTAAYGMQSRDSGAAAAGLAIMLIGAAMKASSAADCRHCEFLPQRTYVALINHTNRGDVVELMVNNDPSSRIVLSTLTPPPADECQLRYVRLPMVASSWATSGQIYYSNDITGEVNGDQLPYILGGRCVRIPTPETLSAYQRSGYLRDFTFDDLLDLYREEGIIIADVATDADFGRHVLEGGNWLYTPTPGSTGSLRLFGQHHPPYVPRSERGQMLVQEINAGVSSHAMAH